jgi:hypothetical protein
LLEDSVEERMEKALAESDKIEAESKDADAEDNKARNSFVISESSHIICSLICTVAIEIPTFVLLVCLRMCPQQPNCIICRL